MQTIRSLEALRRSVSLLKRDGGGLAFVPTMGALHAGHLALVEEARRHARHVAVSIFVNPTQFGPNEDLDRYPRREAEDAALLEGAGVAILWAPDVATMYPQGFGTSVHVAGPSGGLDGDFRPGHFDGVATVVTKLLGQVAPDIALFGEKDYQQLAVIRKLVRDLDLPVAIHGVATKREPDGLALSSRNQYLSPDERIAARALPEALNEAAAAIAEGADTGSAIDTAKSRVTAAGFRSIDYIALCDAETLAPLEEVDRPARLLAAAWLGGTRLIDNLPVFPAAFQS